MEFRGGELREKKSKAGIDWRKMKKTEKDGHK